MGVESGHNALRKKIRREAGMHSQRLARGAETRDVVGRTAEKVRRPLSVRGKRFGDRAAESTGLAVFLDRHDQRRFLRSLSDRINVHGFHGMHAEHSCL